MLTNLEVYIEPEEVHPSNAEKVLKFLNAVTTPDEIDQAVEIVGERDVGVAVAQRILDRRAELGGFTSLHQVAEVPQVGPERFTGIIVTLSSRKSLSQIGLSAHMVRSEYLIGVKKAVDPGTVIETRRKMRGGFRFLEDTANMVIHDLSREKDTCELEALFKSGHSQVHKGTLTDSVSAGYQTCDSCIGDGPEDTFDGTNTVLLVLNLPRTKPGTQVDGVLERENFTRRRSARLHNNPADNAAFGETMVRYGASWIFMQARRARRSDLNPNKWGEPDTVFSLNPRQTVTLTPDDDVLVDVFIPQMLLTDTPDQKQYARQLLTEVLAVPTIRQEIARHGRVYRYRDAAIYSHIVDSVDEWVSHRAHPKCSGCSFGGSPSSGDVTFGGGIYANDPTYGTGGYGSVTYHF